MYKQITKHKDGTISVRLNKEQAMAIACVIGRSRGERPFPYRLYSDLGDAAGYGTPQYERMENFIMDCVPALYFPK